VRRLAVTVLLAVALAAAFAAAAADAESPTDRGGGVPAGVTPVLSARRVPDLLAAPAADRRLRTALEAVLAEVRGTTCLRVSVNGRTVFATDPGQPMVPASLQKLVTAVVALDVLGPDHRFTTAVVAAAPVTDGVVAGDLFVVGGGDPLLQTDPYERHFEHQPQVRTDAEGLADAIVRAGVREVRGGVVGDGSRYDSQRYVPSWPTRFVTQDQTGPLGALTVDDAWAVYPPDPDTKVPDEEPAADPAQHAAALLTDLLETKGVAVAGEPVAGPSPDDAEPVATIDSPPLAEIVGQMLRESDNQTSELLLKEIGLQTGGGGTTAAGVATVEARLRALELPAEGSVVADGSGLAGATRLPCELVQAILERAPAASPIAQGLPVAGESGTLAERFLDSPVRGRLRAKTGTLNQVTALAGFVETTQGADIAFTFIANLPSGSVVAEEDLVRLDEVAAVLVRYPEGPDLADLGPKPVP
jgi:D-alanyl-D-alanine carboxypeptidase/D-alanyl-D-alanine-endopeptidase (penicillin-binding protein 4)